MSQPHKPAHAYKDLEESMEFVKSVQVDQLQLLMDHHAQFVKQTRFLLVEIVFANKDMPIIQQMSALHAPQSLMDLSSMVSVQFALEAWSITEMPVFAHKERSHKVLFASVNAKMMSYWIIKEIAIPVEAIRSSLMEPVSAQLDIH